MRSPACSTSFILRYDAQGDYVPDLATRVPTLRNGDISRDGKQIVVHLRKGVVWADGAPLTAADWLYTYRLVRDPQTAVKSTYGWDEIASAPAPNPYTIVIRLKRPSVRVLRDSRNGRRRLSAFAGPSACENHRPAPVEL